MEAKKRFVAVFRDVNDAWKDSILSPRFGAKFGAVAKLSAPGLRLTTRRRLSNFGVNKAEGGVSLRYLEK